MLIGISGGSGTGKSTISRRLSEILPNSLLVNGDIYMHARSNELENKILARIGETKQDGVFSYNFYLDTFENTKMWAETIKDNVVEDIKNYIKENGEGKDYIIVDWVFLPLCEIYKECDETICVVSDYDIRMDRLTKRLQDKSIYNEGDRSFWSYKEGVMEKRLKFTTLSDYGYESKYYISNNSNLDLLYKQIDILVDAIVGNNIRKEIKRMEYMDIYDKDKNLTGKVIERYESRDNLQEGEYFLFEQAWVINSKGEILMTRRAPNKKYGGIWEPTSGHVKSGETSLQGIKRELNEELGINVKDEELELVKSWIDKKSIKEVWVVRKDISIEDLKFIDDEVSDAKFVTIDSFKNMLEHNETFNNLQYFVKLYKEIMEVK